VTGGWVPYAALAAWAVAFVAAAIAADVGRRKLDAARDAAIAGLVRALAVKDPYTGEHTERVARYSGYIGEELGFSRRRLARLRRAALLHDVGKLAVPGALLNKPDRLTDREFDEVQRHASACTEILGLVDVLRPLAAAAEGHHRRFDGEGYGSRRASKDAAVVAVADAYDAMTSTRAYRRALPQSTAFAELRARAGTQFDPACVDALLRAVAGRGERHGLGWERSRVVFPVEPPAASVGSAALGHVAVLTSTVDLARP
jgi:HD-GYP domain-containing protein (c-di-GMP phosphodiesterase class II)